MSSHEASGAFERVTKSADMNMEVTPSMERSAAAMGSSVSWPAANVFGPSTGVPTVNFSAFGFGVLLTVTAIATQRNAQRLPR